jgi:hypothetical protein
MRVGIEALETIKNCDNMYVETWGPMKDQGHTIRAHQTHNFALNNLRDLRDESPTPH